MFVPLSDAPVAASNNFETPELMDASLHAYSVPRLGAERQ